MMSPNHSSVLGVAFVIAMGLLVGPVIACGPSAEDEERARLRVEIDQLRGEVDRLEAKLEADLSAARIAEPSAVEQVEGQEVEHEPPQRVLVVTPAGVAMDGKTLSAAELDATLAEIAKKHPDTGVVIRADEGASHENVIALLDRVKAAGVQRFALASVAADEPK